MKLASMARGHANLRNQIKSASHGYSDDDIWDIAAIRGILCAVEPDRQRHRDAPNGGAAP
jgi:hypothetical protein